MITHAPLTPEQQKASRKFYCLFNLFNGLSYVCLGELIIILLAIRLERSNYVISALGGMLYLGYLLLPLGKTMTAHKGGVRCQEIFWIIRNIAILLVVLAVPVYYAGWDMFCTVLLLSAIFIFYGCRAAGVATVAPLYAEFTTPHTRSAFVAACSTFFYSFTFIGLLVIITVLKIYGSGIKQLTGIVITGACIGILSTRFLSKTCESGQLCEYAKKPVAGDLKILMHDTVFRRYLAGNFLVCLTGVLLNPISMAAIKRGYAISDSTALIFGLIIQASCAIVGYLAGKPMRAIGPRRFCGMLFLATLIIGPLWFFSPAEKNYGLLGIIFLLIGSGSVCMSNAMTMYFLQTVKEDLQVMGSIIACVVSGVGAGLAGIAVSSLLFKILTPLYSTANYPPLTLYRMYFIWASIILLPGIVLFIRMKPLPIEKRKWKPFSVMRHH